MSAGVTMIQHTVRPRRRNRSAGGAAVEFAIVLPLFCAVLFGIIDYGWYFYQRFSLVAALRDGVRYGVTQPQATAWSAAQTRAIADLTATYVPTTGITWGPTTTITGTAPNQVMTLTASMTFTPLIGFVPTPPTLFGSITMMLELGNDS